MEVLREYEAMYEEYLKIEPELDHETHHTPDVIVVSCPCNNEHCYIVTLISAGPAAVTRGYGPILRETEKCCKFQLVISLVACPSNFSVICCFSEANSAL